jgi:hypothetical protein
MGYVTWTDADGFATLSNLKPHKAARRLRGWLPGVDRISDTKTALGTGIFYEFLYRQDYTASFTLDAIPVTQTALILRFLNFIMQGCAFTLYTEDAQDRVYSVRMRPTTKPSLEQSDATLLEYALTLEVISATGPQEPLLCHYRE